MGPLRHGRDRVEPARHEPGAVAQSESDRPAPCVVQRGRRDVHTQQRGPRRGSYPEPGAAPSTPDVDQGLVDLETEVIDKGRELCPRDEAVRLELRGVL